MTEPQEFVSLALTGPRFERLGMPVDALPELAAYHDLLVVVAKAVFRRHNPGRVRVPKGFSESFQLRLLAVRPGSVVPVLERIIPEEADPLFVDRVDVFDEARDFVEEVLREIARTGQLSDGFPDEAIPELSRFGRTLRPGEAISIGHEEDRDPVIYTPMVRRAFLQSRGRLYLSDATATGVITEISTEHSTFTLRVGDRLVYCTFADDLFELIRFNLKGPEVSVEGVALLDADDQPARFAFVSRILPAEGGDDDQDDSRNEEDSNEYSRMESRSSTDLSERLDEIQALDEGWLDGSGSKVSDQIVSVVRNLLPLFTAMNSPHFYLYPTEEGGIQVEWARGSCEYSLNFPNEKRAIFSLLDIESGREVDEEVDVADRSRFPELLGVEGL